MTPTFCEGVEGGKCEDPTLTYVAPTKYLVALQAARVVGVADVIHTHTWVGLGP